jgi:FAD/FMN-containing dehydrogenase
MNTLLHDLQGLTVITDPSTVTKLSQDYHTFSPILHPLLDQKRADMVVIPTNEEQVLQAAQACVRHRIPSR